MISRMGRPREFDAGAVVEAAKQLFWTCGYLTTTVADLEQATGLSRSSLYATFTSKRDLFAAVLGVYVETFIDPLIGPLETQDAGPAEIIGYFKVVEALFEDPVAQRGCLLINTIGESAGRDPDLTRDAERYLVRVRAAFANALKSSVKVGVMTRRQATERSALLAGAVLGVWMTVRVDASSARALCVAWVSQVEAWTSPPTA
jgi:AcrR family transcriptional regulator